MKLKDEVKVREEKKRKEKEDQSGGDIFNDYLALQLSEVRLYGLQLGDEDLYIRKGHSVAVEKFAACKGSRII